MSLIKYDEQNMSCTVYSYMFSIPTDLHSVKVSLGHMQNKIMVGVKVKSCNISRETLIPPTQCLRPTECTIQNAEKQAILNNRTETMKNYEHQNTRIHSTNISF